ncbi:hypothetical protein RHECNPAF_2000013 [Rhizobium etli CNPAF512]|nr:hypothetical protein RHECNPAF_2000013 [Rhizobium etli CNPAF512]
MRPASPIPIGAKLFFPARFSLVRPVIGCRPSTGWEGHSGKCTTDALLTGLGSGT